MPVYKQRVVLELVRNLRAFLNLELGLVRGPVSNQSGAQSPEVESLRKQLEAARKQLENSEQAGVGSRAWREDDATDPGKMVWIFGTGRSGSTWLRSILSETKHSTVWEEPMVGRLFGKFYNEAQTGQLNSPKFIFGNPTRSAWIKSIRNFVLDGARWANPGLHNGRYLIIKEPNGSEGAPLLMAALPESRMILLVRDPRDVVASVVDGAREGSWLHGRKDEWVWRATLPDMQTDRFVEHRAKMYMRHIEGARQAYGIHKGRKVMVKYEDLLDDTLATMRRAYLTLEIPFEEAELKRTIEKYSWENIPNDQKGNGKFYRKATPGGWRNDLTPGQVEIIENITASVIEDFYTD